MSRPRLPAAALWLLVAALAAGGCDRQPEPPASQPDQSYDARGQVTAVTPGIGDVAPRLTIRHEAIPDFVSFDGDVVGMASMTMAFPLAAEVDLAGIAVGDKIRFTLDVDWDASPPYYISELSELPPETALDFNPLLPTGGAAPPPTGAPPPP